MYWIIIAVIVLVSLYYYFKKAGDLDFWKLAAKFPDEALDMCLQGSNLPLTAT